MHCSGLLLRPFYLFYDMGKWSCFSRLQSLFIAYSSSFPIPGSHPQYAGKVEGYRAGNTEGLDAGKLAGLKIGEEQPK